MTTSQLIDIYLENQEELLVAKKIELDFATER